MSQSIRDYLARKDGDFDKFVPQSYKLSADQKNQVLFLDTLTTNYTLTKAAGCMKSCFNNLESPVVSQTESDCMTNCTAKALETLTHF